MNNTLKKWAAEFAGTFWLTFGGCGSAVLAAAFPDLGIGFVGVVSGYAFYSRDLPDPARLFEGLEFEQPSVIYDRTGATELARFGVLRRELLTFDQLPPEMIDATNTAILAAAKSVAVGNAWLAMNSDMVKPIPASAPAPANCRHE